MCVPCLCISLMLEFLFLQSASDSQSEDRSKCNTPNGENVSTTTTTNTSSSNLNQPSVTTQTAVTTRVTATAKVKVEVHGPSISSKFPFYFNNFRHFSSIHCMCDEFHLQNLAKENLTSLCLYIKFYLIFCYQKVSFLKLFLFLHSTVLFY